MPIVTRSVREKTYHSYKKTQSTGSCTEVLQSGGSFLTSLVEYTGLKAQHSEICDTIGWPALPSRHSACCGWLQRGVLATNLPNNKVYN